MSMMPLFMKGKDLIAKGAKGASAVMAGGAAAEGAETLLTKKNVIHALLAWLGMDVAGTALDIGGTTAKTALSKKFPTAEFDLQKRILEMDIDEKGKDRAARTMLRQQELQDTKNLTKAALRKETGESHAATAQELLSSPANVTALGRDPVLLSNIFKFLG